MWNHTKWNVRFRERYGPWAVVTGASSGIGREIADRLAMIGLNLVLVARDESKLSQLAKQSREQHRVETRVIPADLATADGIANVRDGCSGIDVGLLVASAGFGTSGEFLDSTLESEREMLAVNCEALVSLSWYFGRQFRQRGRGGLILMSSIVGFQGMPFASHYAATKAYVQTLAEGLSIELRRHGVDVLASAPGPTESGFAERANMKMGKALRPVDVAQRTLNALGRKTTVLPGFLSKLLRYSLAPLPRWARIRIMGKVMRGMTKHQQIESITPTV